MTERHLATSGVHLNADLARAMRNRDNLLPSGEPTTGRLHCGLRGPPDGRVLTVLEGVGKLTLVPEALADLRRGVHSPALDIMPVTASALPE